MYKNKTVAVVVPAYNEEKQIGMVIETMPDFVDRIIIVNDGSTDNTVYVVSQYIKKDKHLKKEIKDIFSKDIVQNEFNRSEIILREFQKAEIKFFPPSEVLNQTPDNDRIILIKQLRNHGNGKAVARGFKWAKDHAIDCTAVMDGDGQMDPGELESITRPIVEENVDYVKGNRLRHESSWLIVPKIRHFGNSVLSLLTKIASGYWRVSDTQTGYVALSKKALHCIRLSKLYKSYGWPNDLLVRLNMANRSIKEVEIKPVYKIGKKSKMKIFKVIPRISFLLFKSFFKRLWGKYLFKDFHPLFFLYHFSFIMALICLPYLIKIIEAFLSRSVLSYEPLLAFIFSFSISFLGLLFAMWMDIQDNERLYKE